MLEEIYERIKGIILKPVETFKAAENDKLSFTILYYFVLLAIFGILFSLVLSQMWYYLLLSNQMTFTILKMLGLMVVSFFIGTVWLHLWVYILGSRRGIKNTLKIVSYSMTPSLLLGCLYPVGMLVGTVWSFILEVIGIRELHGLSLGRSIIAIVLYVGVLFGIVLLYVYLTGLTGSTGSAGSTTQTFL